MEIGTAKPSPEERSQIKHFFINNLSIEEDYDVGKYEKEAILLLENLFKIHETVILTGGSGLYLDAVAGGLDRIPQVDPSIRMELNLVFQKEGMGLLLERLKKMDPAYYQQVDLANPQRVIRALEVCIGTGKPYSSFRKKRIKERPFQIIKIALERERQELYDRIDSRMDQMIAEGLFEEAKNLYPLKDVNALQTVGYREIFGYLDKEYDLEEAVRLLKRNSRRFAKRQMTWLRKDPGYQWFHPSQLQDIINYIRNQMLG